MSRIIQLWCSPLETHDGEDGHAEGEAKPSRDAATASRHNGSRSGGAETASADGGANRSRGKAGGGGEAGGAADGRATTGSTGSTAKAAARSATRSATRSAGLHREGGRGHGDDAYGARLGGEANLWHRQGGADDDRGAGARDDHTGIVRAGDNRGGIDSDGRVDGDDGGRGSSDVGGNTSRDAGVAGNEGRADALEVDDGLGHDGLCLAVCVDALQHVLEEEGVGAVAWGIRVVPAADAEEEGVQASRDNTRAGKRLNRGGGSGGGTRQHRSGRSSGDNDGLGGGRDGDRRGDDDVGGRGCQHSGEGLGDRADGSANCDGHHRGLDRAGRAVGDGGSAAGDGRHNSGEDGRGSLEAGDHGGGDLTGGEHGGWLRVDRERGAACHNWRDGLAGFNDGRHRHAGLDDGGYRLARLDDRRNRHAGFDNGRHRLARLDNGRHRLARLDNGRHRHAGFDNGRDSLAGLNDRRHSRAGLDSRRHSLAGFRGRDDLARRLRWGCAADNRSAEGGEGRRCVDRGRAGGGRDRRSGQARGGLRGGRRVAVEGDSGDVDAAGWLGLAGLRGEHDDDILGAAALVVDDGGTGLLAGVAVLASLAVGHLIVKLEVAVELGLHVDGAERELVDGTAGSERRGCALVRGAASAEELATGAAAEAATRTSWGIAAREAFPVEVLVLVDRAHDEILEREAGLLGLGTLVVCVCRAVEGREVAEALEMG